MARVNKKAQPYGPQTAQKPQSKTPEPAAAPPTAATPAKPTIRKGVYLSALIYVEGEQAAPDDFTGLATSALKAALAASSKGQPAGLSMTLKKVDVQNDVEEADSESKPGKEDKFQF